MFDSAHFPAGEQGVTPRTNESSLFASRNPFCRCGARYIWKKAFLQSGHVHQLLQKLRLLLPGHGLIPARRYPWGKSNALLLFAPKETQCHYPAVDSRPQQPVLFHANGATWRDEETSWQWP